MNTAECYDDVFTIDRHGPVSMIKIRVVQAMIQIIRPMLNGI